MPRPFVIIVLAIALILVMALVPAIEARFFASSGVDQRLDFWRAAGAMFGGDPLTGSGPATFAQLKFALNPEGAPNLVVPHAHSIYVQTLAEEGLIGSVGLIAVTAVIGRRWLRAFKRHPNLRPTVAAGVAAVIGLAAQLSVDNLLNLPSVALTVIAVLAWVEGAIAIQMPEGVWSGQPRFVAAPLAVLAAGTIAVIGFAVPFARAAIVADDGVFAADVGDWATAFSRFDEAVQLDRGMSLYLLERGIAESQLGRVGDGRTDLADVVEADGFPMTIASLARLDLAAGDEVRAKERARMAFTIGSQDENVALNVGAIAEALGDRDLALRAYGTAIDRDPELAASAFWDSADRSVGLAEVSEVAIALSDTDSPADEIHDALIRGYAGDVDAAQMTLETMQPSPARNVALAAMAWTLGDDARAIDMLEETLAEDPRDQAAALLVFRYAVALNDESRMAGYGRWVKTLGYASAAQSQGRGSLVLVTGPKTPSFVPSNYPSAVYLRRAPRTLAPPGFLIIDPDPATTPRPHQLGEMASK
jgi:tetratricopeptide (TPR) repeat protein